jgi:hypothetical protein
VLADGTSAASSPIRDFGTPVLAAQYSLQVYNGNKISLFDPDQIAAKNGAWIFFCS